jgi:hypothetical protein
MGLYLHTCHTFPCISNTHHYGKSRRAVGAQWYALGYRVDDLGFDSWRGLGIILFTTASRTALGPTQPSIQWVRGTVSLGVKRPGREADHSPPSSAEVKKARSYTSTPQYVFMAWCLVKNRDNFTLTFTVKGAGLT